MIDFQDLLKSLPNTGRIVITCENGSITGARIVKENEHVASLNALIDLAKSAGYSVVRPDGNAL
ncbi:hypothetical protein OQJ40_09095 [Serratia nevei]|uniref:hypothetical protein n=1 Tax=Serratia nevei TaxID=2703794 RepID=UPI0027D285B8|nr:hypothetical protein [Serratia nevei]WMC77240.1 hypothetical protein O8I25_08875 [Serratia nevei]WMC82697.1 hypothetical protein O8I24_09095 [Serratia nevei]